MLENFIDKSRIPVFYCIGTMMSLADGVAPMIGDKLKALGYIVYGTSDDQWHNLTIIDKHEKYHKTLATDWFQPIAIDFSVFTSLENIFEVKPKPCKPGNAILRILPEVGELVIYVNAIKIFEHIMKLSDVSVSKFIYKYLANIETYDFMADKQKLDFIVDTVVDEINKTYKLIG